MTTNETTVVETVVSNHFPMLPHAGELLPMGGDAWLERRWAYLSLDWLYEIFIVDMGAFAKSDDSAFDELREWYYTRGKAQCSPEEQRRAEKGINWLFDCIQNGVDYDEDVYEATRYKGVAMSYAGKRYDLDDMIKAVKHVRRFIGLQLCDIRKEMETATPEEVETLTARDDQLSSWGTTLLHIMQAYWNIEDSK